MKKVIFSKNSLRTFINEEIVRKQLINEVSGVSEEVKILTDVCINEIELSYQEKKEEYQKKANSVNSSLDFLNFEYSFEKKLYLNSDENLNKYPELRKVINSKIADKETKQKPSKHFNEGYPLNRSLLILSIFIVSTTNENKALKEIQKANASSQMIYDKETKHIIGSQVNAKVVFLNGELLKLYAYDTLSHELMHSYIKIDLCSRPKNMTKTNDEIVYRKRKTYDKATDILSKFDTDKQYDLNYIISGIFYLIRREETLSYSNGVYNSLNYYKEAVPSQNTDYLSIFSMIKKTNGYYSLTELYCFVNTLNFFTDAQIYEVLDKNYKKELGHDIRRNNPQSKRTNYQIRVNDFKKMAKTALRKTIKQYIKVINYIYIELFNYNSTVMKKIWYDVNNDLKSKYEKEYYPAFVSYMNTLTHN